MDIKKRLACADCLEKMKSIPDNSVDLVLTDPPYGATACQWDSIIPLDQMWEQLLRIGRPHCVFVLMAAQPFTSVLVMSQIELFKYCWLWEKDRGTNFVHAKNMPIRSTEDAVVFSRAPICHKTDDEQKRMPYNPQGIFRVNKTVRGKPGGRGDEHKLARKSHKLVRTVEYEHYPKNVLKFSNEVGSHPTQKPVALMKYFIKTYTDDGGNVLDFTMGSGTTGVACVLTGRNFIGIERDPKYFEIAKNRIDGAKSQIGFGFA